MATTFRCATAAIAAPLAALAVSACGGNPNLDIPGKNDETVTVTVTGKGGLDPAVIGGGAPAESCEQVPNCNRDMDLSETTFAPFGWTKKVLILENGGAKVSNGQAFHFTMKENQFEGLLRWLVTVGYAASQAAGVTMVSYSTGVNPPRRACRRRRW